MRRRSCGGSGGGCGLPVDEGGGISGVDMGGEKDRGRGG